MQDNHNQLIDEAVLDSEFQQAQEAIRRGERARVLIELVLQEIGLEQGSKAQAFWEKLKQVQDEYTEAVNLLSTIVKETRQQTQGVS